MLTISKKNILSIVVFCLCGNLCAQETLMEIRKTPSYLGGMGIGLSYRCLENEFGEVKGFSYSVGGRLQKYLGTHWRVGGLGGKLSMSYSPDESSFSFGYGGVTGEYIYSWNRLTLAGGILIGGGSINNMQVIATLPDGYIRAHRSTYGSLFVSPLLTVEYRIFKSITAFAMADYYWGTHFGNGHTLGGSQITLGIVFVR